jgi:DNA-binding MarR family transcriptional regulator
MIVSFETNSIGNQAMSGKNGQNGNGLMLEAFLPYRLAVLAHATSRALSSVYAEQFGLSIAEWRILANLDRFGPLYAGELAERSSLDKPKVTRALQRLEAAGLAHRTVDPEDRRQVRILLSRRGRNVFRCIAALALEWETKFLAPLAKNERRALEHILTKLMQRVEDMPARNGRGPFRLGTASGAEAS